MVVPLAKTHLSFFANLALTIEKSRLVNFCMSIEAAWAVPPHPRTSCSLNTLWKLNLCNLKRKNSCMANPPILLCDSLSAKNVTIQHLFINLEWVNTQPATVFPWQLQVRSTPIKAPAHDPNPAPQSVGALNPWRRRYRMRITPPPPPTPTFTFFIPWLQWYFVSHIRKKQARNETSLVCSMGYHREQRLSSCGSRTPVTVPISTHCILWALLLSPSSRLCSGFFFLVQREKKSAVCKKGIRWL